MATSFRFLLNAGLGGLGFKAVSKGSGSVKRCLRGRLRVASNIILAIAIVALGRAKGESTPARPRAKRDAPVALRLPGNFARACVYFRLPHDRYSPKLETTLWRQFVDKKFISSSRPLISSSLRVISLCHHFISSCRPVISLCCSLISSFCLVISSCRSFVSLCRPVISSFGRAISSCGSFVSSCRPVISGQLVVLSSHLVVSFFHLVVLSCHLLESSCHLVVLSCHLVISFIKSTKDWILGFEKREVRKLTCFPAFAHRFSQDGRSQCCKGYFERRPVSN